MRIIRFISGSAITFGKQIGSDTAERLAGNAVTELAPTGDVVKIDKLLAPLVPADILCIGLNYKDHAVETGASLPQHPMLFIKSGNTLNDPDGIVPMPRLSRQIDYEGELAVVIGRDARDVLRADAMAYVLGYTIANDVSARDWQKDKALGGGQFARGKSFDGFCPLGPAIVTRDDIANPNGLKITTTLNGQLMQDGTTAEMIFDVPALIESLSSTMTIRAGSVILTGTPAGVGTARKPPVYMKSGDTVVVEIESIGRLTSYVR
jgi:2-keto-4-pentenoate hydratase/2-oxohepta-3-ene-1,7-dioic acid hydratase in catechol pathway